MGSAGDSGCTSSGGCHASVWCLPDLPTSCEELRTKFGVTDNGVYTIGTADGGVDVRCEFSNSRFWTLVYKIADKSTMMTKGSSNTYALSVEDGSTDSGKLSDAAIRKLCKGQYHIRQ